MLIEIDFSNCGRIRREIKFAGVDTSNGHYAICVYNDLNHYDYITQLDSTIISDVQEIADSSIKVNHNENVFVFLDQNQKLISSQNFIYNPIERINNDYYKYQNQYIYYIPEVTKDITISPIGDDDADSSVITYDKLANIVYRCSQSEIVKIGYCGASLENEPIDAPWQSSRGFGYSFIYIGDKQSYQDEQENDPLGDYLEILGKKAYYKLELNSDFFNPGDKAEDVASFYLVKNLWDDTTDLEPLTIKSDGQCEYLEIQKSDLEDFIRDGEAGLYLLTVVKEDVLNDFIGFKLNYLNGDTYTGLTMLINEAGQDENYFEYSKDKQMIYYYHSSIVPSDVITFNIKYGNSPYINVKPFIDKIQITFIKNDIIDDSMQAVECVTTKYHNELIRSTDSDGIQAGVEKICEIRVNTTFQAPDESEHPVNFDIGDSTPDKFFISNSITDPNWIEVKEENLKQLTALKISVSSPLYFYTESESNRFIKLYYEYIEYYADEHQEIHEEEKERPVSNYYPISNIFGYQIKAKKDDQYYNVYALCIIDPYLLPNAPLTLRFINYKQKNQHFCDKI